MQIYVCETVDVYSVTYINQIKKNDSTNSIIMIVFLVDYIFFKYIYNYHVREIR